VKFIFKVGKKKKDQILKETPFVHLHLKLPVMFDGDMEQLFFCPKFPPLQYFPTHSHCPKMGKTL